MKEWMIFKVLREDEVQTDAEPKKENNWLVRNPRNVVVSLLMGKKGTYQVMPRESGSKIVDYTYLGTSGSLGMNVPPWVEANRGKVVREYFAKDRYGKVL